MVSGPSATDASGVRANLDRLNDKDKMAEMDIKPKDAMDLAISSISAMTFSWG
jgi:hypothetical protein